MLSVPSPQAIAPVVLSIREATDRLFRGAAEEGAPTTADMVPFLRACADGLAAASGERLGATENPFGDPSAPLAFEAALAVSALSLLAGEAMKRIRICPNCNWLFLDRSRNSSRLWCDMAVCGNRRKASRHYKRRKAREIDHA
jgi:predicted RNA-binding Zn ribbon-like protein